MAIRTNKGLTRESTLFGHPIGLYVLFFTEMWERFSYYGMRALLILYLTKHLIVTAETGGAVIGFAGLKNCLEWALGPLGIQPLASEIYGLYTAFVYLTPLAGGYLADRILGQRKTVVVGGVLMAIGHFLMAYENLFLIALLFLILGNGCFKPNVSTQVGNLYPKGDPRRDKAFVIFYMGINLGAVISPLVCGTLGQIYGWHYGFTAAGVGMVFGLITYIWGQKFLAEDALKKAEREHVENKPLTKNEWKAIFGLMALCVLNIAFWAVYEQQGNTIQIFADKNVDWHIFGWEMPSTWFQAINPLFIFTVGPLLNMLWTWQSRRKKEPTSIAKMSIGTGALGLSFLILMYLVKDMTDAQKMSFVLLAAVTLIYTVGELFVSPIGLSFVTKVAPAKVGGLMMGIWFLAVFFGNLSSGHIGRFYDVMSRANFFLLLAAISAVASLAIFALKKPIQKAIGKDV